MDENQYNFDLRDALERYAHGELSATEIDALTHRVHRDPELRSAWTEFQISRYIDGELTRTDVAELTERIENDPLLQEAVGEYEALEAELVGLADDVPEFDYVVQREEILAAVDRRRFRRMTRVQRWVLRPALVTVAAAAVFMLVFGVYLMLRPTAPVPSEEFRVVVLPGVAIPPVAGRVEVNLLPGDAGRAKKIRGGSVVAVAGAPGPEPLARGMSMYMMLASGMGYPSRDMAMDFESTLATLCSTEPYVQNIQNVQR